jgi:hypothetical protein
VRTAVRTGLDLRTRGAYVRCRLRGLEAMRGRVVDVSAVVVLVNKTL